MTNLIDPFEGCPVIPGLEELGRAILDADGQVSGSPANWETLRGSNRPVTSIAPDIRSKTTEHLAKNINAVFGLPDEIKPEGKV
jgi:hypothetical protein